MRAIFGLLLALLFVVHTASATDTRRPDCCEEVCADIHCVPLSCVCQPVSLSGMSALPFKPSGQAATQAPLFLNPGIRIEDIWRPPWAGV